MSIDSELEGLQKRFPLWQIWYVPSATQKFGTWCANPWAREHDRRNVLHADIAEHLADEIRDYEADHSGQFIAPEGS